MQVNCFHIDMMLSLNVSVELTLCHLQAKVFYLVKYIRVHVCILRGRSRDHWGHVMSQVYS